MYHKQIIPDGNNDCFECLELYQIWFKKEEIEAING